MPSFNIQGGFCALAFRAASVAALLSLVGTVIFRVFVLARAIPPGPARKPIDKALRRLSRRGLFAGLIFHLGWLLAQTENMADAETGREILTALPLVAFHTQFGRLILLQCAMLPLVALMPERSRFGVGIIAATVALAVQAGHGHVAAMQTDFPFLVCVDWVHLASAAGWLGGLIPLLIVVSLSSPKEAMATARWFTPMGKICVVSIAISALVQGWILIARPDGLFHTGYGWMALIKMGLTGVLTVFAVVNRYWLGPSLLGEQKTRTRRALLWSLSIQTACGLLVVVAAAILSNLQSPMHMTMVGVLAPLPHDSREVASR